jgi:hypothetical protein
MADKKIDIILQVVDSEHNKEIDVQKELLCDIMMEQQETV